jgi:hypothetical protein
LSSLKTLYSRCSWHFWVTGPRPRLIAYTETGFSAAAAREMSEARIGSLD